MAMGLILIIGAVVAVVLVAGVLVSVLGKSSGNDKGDDPSRR